MFKVIQQLIGFSLRRPYFILLAAFGLLLWGVVTFKQMPIEAFPDVTNTEITLITQWPGRSAEEVEKFITIPIEVSLNPVQKKVSLRSTSMFGLSYVKLVFEDRVTNDQARIQVNDLIKNADLPDGIVPEVQPPTGPAGEIFRYTLRSTHKNVTELKSIQDWVIDRELRSVPGVADVVSFGGKTKTYQINVDPVRMSNLGITSLDVFEAVTKSNINIGGDIIQRNDQAYVVRGVGLLNNKDEIKNIIVENVNGIPILVKDIADVEISYLPRLGHVGRTDRNEHDSTKLDDEEDVVEGVILMRKEENPAEVVQGVKEKIEKLNKDLIPEKTEIVAFYDREDLINFASHTVLTNLTEGILLVTLIVSLFMFNWRTTLIVSIVIPLALLFAFICLRLMGMSANLLSLGAIDFGIIIDGAVVMVEGIFVALDHRAKGIGMERFNRLAKKSLIKIKGAELGKSIFFAKLIIIAALLPIFSFQKVEGKLFSPLAYTLGFALLGALLLTLTLVPVLISFLMRKNVREKNNVVVNWISGQMMRAYHYTYRHRKTSIFVSTVLVMAGLTSFHFLGSEFLPELDEGSIWLRVQLPYSVSLDKSVEISRQVRYKVMEFPEVKNVLSQTGRPDDGTDVAGFYNNEFDIKLFPKKSWKSGISKDQLVTKMNDRLSAIPGIELNFSQPITDNIEEAVSGVKGSICVKIFGDSLNYMEQKAQEVYHQLNRVNGITDLAVIKNIGQPELNIDLDQQKMALYGVSTADANAVIEMAIGGKSATLLFEGIRKFQVRIRIPEAYRNTNEDIGNLMVPTMNGSKIPIKEIATISLRTAPALIFRDANKRYSAVKFSVRGRDMGSAIEEARGLVSSEVKLKNGYALVWQGDFENQQRASDRLQKVVPISLLFIFLILFSMFGNFRDAGLAFLNVPFAIVGGIVALFVTHTNFSISAGIGFIALFGICILFGVLLMTEFKNNLNVRKGKRKNLHQAVLEGVRLRIRPVLMTALMAAVGLVPAALSQGIGSESSRPLARVVIGGVIFALFFSLLIFPHIFEMVYHRSEKRSKQKGNI